MARPAQLDRAVLAHIAEHVFTEERCQEILRDFVEDQGVPRQKSAERRRVLERERDELGKRLERWYERIETELDLGEVGAERLRELKAKWEEVVRTQQGPTAALCPAVPVQTRDDSALSKPLAHRLEPPAEEFSPTSMIGAPEGIRAVGRMTNDVARGAADSAQIRT